MQRELLEVFCTFSSRISGVLATKIEFDQASAVRQDGTVSCLSFVISNNY